MPKKKTPNRIPVRFEDSAESEAMATDRASVVDSLHADDDPSEPPEDPDTDEHADRHNGGATLETSEDWPASDIAAEPETETATGNSFESSAGNAVEAGQEESAAVASDNGPAVSTQGSDLAYGPMLAELIATRSELKRVESELKRLSGEKLDLADRLARRQADFENYRKRVDRERGEIAHRALGDVVTRLLPVVDNLSRALAAEASMEAGESEEFRHFLHGVELIEKQLAGVLTSLGVETVPTVGQKFDPHVHEAVQTVETSDVEPDTVTEEMRRGYSIGNKLLRPAMVKVSK
jgi:molecular chaperone GrpE